MMQILNQISLFETLQIGKVANWERISQFAEKMSFPICKDIPNLRVQIGHNFPNLLQIGKIWSPVKGP